MLLLLRPPQRNPSPVGTVQGVDIALGSVLHPSVFIALDVDIPILRLVDVLVAQKTTPRVLR